MITTRIIASIESIEKRKMKDAINCATVIISVVEMSVMRLETVLMSLMSRFSTSPE